MSRRRRRILPTAAAIGVVAGVVYQAWPGHRTPLRVAFDRIEIGMARADLLALQPPPPWTAGRTYRGGSLEWVGRVDGKVRRVRVPDLALISHEPGLSRSLLVTGDTRVLTDGAVDRVAEDLRWEAETDDLVVLDTDGRVAEAAYYRFNVGWLPHVRDWLTRRGRSRSPKADAVRTHGAAAPVIRRAH
jgi:hypothetical protein